MANLAILITRGACLCLLCGQLAGCGNDATAPTPDAQALTFRGVVGDSVGNPVEGALVAALLWSDDSSTAARGSIPIDVTDAGGAFVLRSDTVIQSLVDSVLIQTVSPGCERDPLDTVLPANALEEGGAQGIAITQPHVLPRASTQSNLVCAFGVHPFWGSLSYLLALQVNVVSGTSLQGRWRIVYRFTSSDDNGSFVGAQTNEFVLLDLTHDNPSPGCTSMRLVGDVMPNGMWGAMHVVAQHGCVPEPYPFTFVEDTFLVVP